MTNPLLEKYEEIYGEKKVVPPVVEEKLRPLAKLKEVVASAQYRGTMGNDIISLGGDTVIPTAQKMPDGGINLTGDYLSISTCDSFNVLTSSQKTYTVPNQTAVEQQFNKVLDDISKGKAVVSSINAEIDQSFTGFGGQIRYTVEIVGTYP
jgi:hypothetical protein